MWHLCVQTPVNVYEGVYVNYLFCLLLPNLQYISSCGNWFIVHGTAVLFLSSDPVNIFCLLHLPLKETLSSKITDKIKVFLEDSCKAKGIPDVGSETTACSSDWAHCLAKCIFCFNLP